MSRMSVNLSPEMEALIEETSCSDGITKVEVIRKAFALLQLSETEKKKGRALGIIVEDPEKHELRVVGKIIGL